MSRASRPDRTGLSRAGRRWCCLLSVLLLGGCAHYPVNPPLDRHAAAGGLQVQGPSRPGNSEKLLVVLTFSGGGTRAAAFSYGVLEALAQTEIDWDGRRRRLLDEVDVISAVSGGSFTAAYYGLYGARIFRDFEERVLRRNITTALTLRLLSPFNWVRLASPYFQRSELAAEYYDKHIFDGGTFGDVQARGGPAIIINATDITLGTRFGFVQSQFDWICSDISRFPVARAVAASSAAPIVLTPITLRNHAGSCQNRPPEWVADALRSEATSSRRYEQAARLASYLNAEERPFIHLLDGGLSDNLGLRAPLDEITLVGAAQLFEREGLEHTEKVIFIVVNAQTEPDRRWDRQEGGPSLAGVVMSATTVPLNRYNFETIDFLRGNLMAWGDQLRARRCGADACPETEFHLVEVNFDMLSDPHERRFLTQLPTSLNLPPRAIERLRAAAGCILEKSGPFRHFLSGVGGSRTSYQKQCQAVNQGGAGLPGQATGKGESALHDR